MCFPNALFRDRVLFVLTDLKLKIPLPQFLNIRDLLVHDVTRPSPKHFFKKEEIQWLPFNLVLTIAHLFQIPLRENIGF